MAGKIKQMIETIIEERGQGDPVIGSTTKTKLMLKGINPDKFTESSEDDPVVIEKLKSVAEQMNIKL